MASWHPSATLPRKRVLKSTCVFCARIRPVTELIRGHRGDYCPWTDKTCIDTRDTPLRRPR